LGSAVIVKAEFANGAAREASAARVGIGAD